MTTTAPTWLDIIPALPGQDDPFVPTVRAQRGRWVTHLETGTLVVVDLGNEQGFGFALRLYYRKMLARVGPPFARFPRLMERHLSGNTTDADRVGLARALAEVTT